MRHQRSRPSTEEKYHTIAPAKQAIITSLHKTVSPSASPDGNAPHHSTVTQGIIAPIKHSIIALCVNRQKSTVSSPRYTRHQRSRPSTEEKYHTIASAKQAIIVPLNTPSLPPTNNASTPSVSPEDEALHQHPLPRAISALKKKASHNHNATVSEANSRQRNMPYKNEDSLAKQQNSKEEQNNIYNRTERRIIEHHKKRSSRA